MSERILDESTLVVFKESRDPRKGLYIRISEYAKKHGMKPDTIRRLCRSGELEAVKVGYWLVWDGEASRD